MKSDRTGNHLTFGAKTGKPPFYFPDVEKAWGRRFDRLIDLSQQSKALFSGAVIQGADTFPSTLTQLISPQSSL